METLEIPFHFSSLMDNLHSARRFRLEIIDLDANYRPSGQSPPLPSFANDCIFFIDL